MRWLLKRLAFSEISYTGYSVYFVNLGYGIVVCYGFFEIVVFGRKVCKHDAARKSVLITRERVITVSSHDQGPRERVITVSSQDSGGIPRRVTVFSQNGLTPARVTALDAQEIGDEILIDIQEKFSTDKMVKVMSKEIGHPERRATTVNSSEVPEVISSQYASL